MAVKVTAWPIFEGFSELPRVTVLDDCVVPVAVTFRLNSEVLPPASVAVAVTTWLPTLPVPVKMNEALPLPSSRHVRETAQVEPPCPCPEAWPERSL